MGLIESRKSRIRSATICAGEDVLYNRFGFLGGYRFYMGTFRHHMMINVVIGEILTNACYRHITKTLVMYILFVARSAIFVVTAAVLIHVSVRFVPGKLMVYNNCRHTYFFGAGSHVMRDEFALPQIMMALFTAIRQIQFSDILIVNIKSIKRALVNLRG